MYLPMIAVGGSMHGGFQEQEFVPAHWHGHVQVDDADAALARAEALGGSALMPPMDIPEVGRFVLLSDPQGGVVSAYRPSADGPAAEGVFVWDELLAEDVDGARAFYTDVFGWTTGEMDMGPMGVYTLFRRAGGVDSAGLMRKPENVPVRAAWTTYLGTGDVDATVAKATALGGQVMMEGMDVPDVGRIAVLGDPVGAVFGLFTPRG